MDDLNEKLSAILNDPQSMERVRQMAESLLGDDSKQEAAPISPLSDILGNNASANPIEIAKIMDILSRLKQRKNDPRAALLEALKPNLSEERRKKVDTAIKILSFIEILPYLKESGILNI